MWPSSHNSSDWNWSKPPAAFLLSAQMLSLAAPLRSSDHQQPFSLMKMSIAKIENERSRS